jgi:hypothetical protein
MKEVNKMTDKRFDELNEIFSNMSKEDYEATKIAADEYYQYGKIELATKLAKKHNITTDELLSWW